MRTKSGVGDEVGGYNRWAWKRTRDGLGWKEGEAFHAVSDGLRRADDAEQCHRR